MTLRWARRRNRVLVLVSTAAVAAVDLASAVDAQHEMVAMKMAKAPTDALILLYYYFVQLKKWMYGLSLAQLLLMEMSELVMQSDRNEVRLCR